MRFVLDMDNIVQKVEGMLMVDIRSVHRVIQRSRHSLNMELDLLSLFGSMCAQLYSLAETPQTPTIPPPEFGLIYEGSIGQPR
jgi:hypothetical protein